MSLEAPRFLELRPELVFSMVSSGSGSISSVSDGSELSPDCSDMVGSAPLVLVLEDSLPLPPPLVEPRPLELPLELPLLPLELEP